MHNKDRYNIQANTPTSCITLYNDIINAIGIKLAGYEYTARGIITFAIGASSVKIHLVGFMFSSSVISFRGVDDATGLYAGFEINATDNTKTYTGYAKLL